MKQNYLILSSIALMSILIIPVSVIPASANIDIAPIAIPGNLIPVVNPSSISPIVPTLPNLGTVTTALPSVTLYSITKAKAGLVASDSLDNEIKSQQELQANPDSWTYGGDSIAENAPYDFFKDTQGLHIGAQAPSSGTWAGVYAVTPNTSAKLFHAVITTPVSTIPSDYYENGLYVQTSQPFINYVACFSSTSSFGTVWALGTVTGDANEGTQFNVLWADTSPNQPLTRDCTIVTNGSNYLKAYIDGVLIYQSSSLNLQMPSPFNAYLEPQSSYSGQLLNGIYKDYYAASDEKVQVTNNPLLASTVKLVDPSGTVLANANVDSSGTATFTIGQFHMPLAAYIKVYNSLGVQVASTSSPVDIFGGDTYNVNSLGSGLGLGGLGL